MTPQTSARRIFRFPKFSGIRTTISLVIASDFECSRPRAVTSVINRYYDPATDQFLSVDPDVATTNQPYVFTNDDPLNSEDPLGLCGGPFGWVCSEFDATRHAVAANAGAVGVGFGLVALTLATGGADVLVIGGIVTADEVTLAAIGAGGVGTYLDANSCAHGSGLGCAGEALGLLSGGSAIVDFSAATSKGVVLVVNEGGFSTAAKISGASGLVGVLVDAVNYVESSKSAASKTVAKKKKK